MDEKGKQLRREIINDIQTVIKLLNESSSVLRTQKGVGCEFCSDQLDDIARRYNGIVSKLNRLT